jgi:hypothetical protein
MPKVTIKTNLEWGPMYFLRHLIQLDGKSINIPYIFLRHISGAFSTTVHSLPYAHLIHKIIRLNGIQIPEEAEVSFPTNLVDHLTKIGWVHGHSSSGLRRYEPDARDINKGINHQEALPNQYWDPEEEVAPAQPQPQPQYMPQAGAFVPPQGQEAQMLWLCQQMNAQSLQIQQNYQETQRRFDNLEKGQMKIRKQLRAHARALNVLDEAQSSLSNRFIKQYGPSGSPARARENLVEEEDLEDDEEEHEEEGDGEEEVADAPNDPMNDE